jgi:iron complex transport system permease protein
MEAGPVRAAGLRVTVLVAAIGALLGAGLLAVLVGPVKLGSTAVLSEMADALPFVDVASGLNDTEAAILWQLRLPRVVLGGLVGAMLSLAGAAYQGVFRNPLADPYLLGVAAGAGLGATLVIAYLPDTSGWLIDPLPLAAFVGALAGVGATYVLGRSGGAGRTATTLILSGVAIASFLTAAQTYFQQRNAETLRQVYAWILGRLSTLGWGEVTMILPYVVITTVVILLHGRLLDVMSVGDEEATTLGLKPGRVRILVVIAASLGTAAAVAVSGLIVFVGIIVPHTVRLLFGWSYRSVLPLSAVFGAFFLVLTDLMARTVMAPAELPIGVITAFFGAPFFVVVLRTTKRMS